MNVTSRSNPTYIVELSEEELSDLTDSIERGLATINYADKLSIRTITLLRLLIARGGAINAKV